MRAAAGAGGGGAHYGGFGNVEAATCVDANAGGGELVPAAKLREGDAEAIGDGDEGVAATRCVVDGVR